MIKKKAVWFMALGTLFVMGGGGALLIPYMREQDLWSFLLGHKPMWMQMIVGAVFGIVTAKAGWEIVRLSFFYQTKMFFVELIKPLKLNTGEVIFISICAGIGEEMLFRGAVQPFIGIWLTAILFVLLHGYLNPFNRPLMIYGIYMVLVIGVIGLFTEHIGIVTAMVAHAFIDFILLKALSEEQLPPDNDSRSE